MRQLQWTDHSGHLVFESPWDHCAVCGAGFIETPDGLTCGERNCRETLPAGVQKLLRDAAEQPEHALRVFKEMEYLPLLAEKQTIVDHAKELVVLLRKLLPPTDPKNQDSVALEQVITKLVDSLT